MKARTIVAKVFAGAVYGIEAAEATNHRINQLIAATIDVFRPRNDNHNTDWFFSNYLTDKADIDPIVQFLPGRPCSCGEQHARKPSSPTNPRGFYNRMPPVVASGHASCDVVSLPGDAREWHLNASAMFITNATLLNY